MLAEIVREHRNEPRAAELYESALAKRPAMLAWRRELADLYGSLGRFEESVALYQELLAARPGDAELLLERGVVLFRTARLAEAEADFREAFSLDPTLPEASFNLGLLALESAREEEAERHLLRALELRPEYGKAHFHLARIYRCRPTATADAPRPSVETPWVRWFPLDALPSTLFPWFRGPIADALAGEPEPVTRREHQGARAVLAGMAIDLRMRLSDDRAG